MTPPDAWVPCPVRRRHLQPGDVVVGKDGRLWAIQLVHTDGIAAVHGVQGHQSKLDPDQVVTVLIPATERDALHLTRAELGARVESRRLNNEQGAA